MAAKPFTTRLDDGLKSRLEAIAVKEDRSASYLAKRAIVQFVEERERDYALVEEARQPIKAGKGIAEERIDAWMEDWASGQDHPFPKA